MKTRPGLKLAFPDNLRVKGYVLVEPLAAGRMGMVYKARDIQAGSDVAVKFMRIADDALDEREARERFERERELLARIHHPHIVRYKDAGEVKVNGHRFMFLVMEFIDGLTTLGIAYDHFPEPAWLLDRIEELLEALEYLRQNNIVHRDLKPDNLGIDKDGKLIVLDLGLARGGERRGITQSGVGVGSLYYASPEQIQDARSVDIRADLYSVGMIMYELLSGSHPLVALSWSESLRRILSGDLPAPVEKLPPALASFISTLLARDPEERFQSPQEALDVLRSMRVSGSLPSPYTGPIPDFSSVSFWENDGVKNNGTLLSYVTSIAIFLLLTGGGGYLLSRLLPM